MGTKFIGIFTLLNPWMKSNFFLKGVSQTLFFVKNLIVSLMLTATLLIFWVGVYFFKLTNILLGGIYSI
jgi:hypothetical protein